MHISKASVNLKQRKLLIRYHPVAIRLPSGCHPVAIRLSSTVAIRLPLSCILFLSDQNPVFIHTELKPHCEPFERCNFCSHSFNRLQPTTAYFALFFKVQQEKKKGLISVCVSFKTRVSPQIGTVKSRNLSHKFGGFKKARDAFGPHSPFEQVCLDGSSGVSSLALAPKTVLHLALRNIQFGHKRCINSCIHLSDLFVTKIIHTSSF